MQRKVKSGRQGVCRAAAKMALVEDREAAWLIAGDPPTSPRSLDQHYLYESIDICTHTYRNMQAPMFLPIMLCKAPTSQNLDEPWSMSQNS